LYREGCDTTWEFEVCFKSGEAGNSVPCLIGLGDIVLGSGWCVVEVLFGSVSVGGVSAAGEDGGGVRCEDVGVDLLGLGLLLALSSELLPEPSEPVSVVQVLSAAPRDSLGLVHDGLDLVLDGLVGLVLQGLLKGGESETHLETQVALAC